MSSQLTCVLPQTSLSEVIERVLDSGLITREDRQEFEAAVWGESLLSVEEQAAVKVVLHRLERGGLRIVD